MATVSDPVAEVTLHAYGTNDGMDAYMSQISIPADADPQPMIAALLALPGVTSVRHVATVTTTHRAS